MKHGVKKWFKELKYIMQNTRKEKNRLLKIARKIWGKNLIKLLKIYKH